MQTVLHLKCQNLRDPSWNILQSRQLSKKSIHTCNKKIFGHWIRISLPKNKHGSNVLVLDTLHLIQAPAKSANLMLILLHNGKMT